MKSDIYKMAIFKPKPKRSKFGNVPTEVDGIKFDSEAEANRYGELMWLVKAGGISELKCHPVFELQAKFKGNDGKMVRALTYEADFQYNENGKIVVEDVKGVETQVFKNKKKLFLKLYPQYDFRMVRLKK